MTNEHDEENSKKDELTKFKQWQKNLKPLLGTIGKIKETVAGWKKSTPSGGDSIGVGEVRRYIQNIHKKDVSVKMDKLQDAFHAYIKNDMAEQKLGTTLKKGTNGDTSKSLLTVLTNLKKHVDFISEKMDAIRTVLLSLANPPPETKRPKGVAGPESADPICMPADGSCKNKALKDSEKITAAYWTVKYAIENFFSVKNEEEKILSHFLGTSTLSTDEIEEMNNMTWGQFRKYHDRLVARAVQVCMKASLVFGEVRGFLSRRLSPASDRIYLNPEYLGGYDQDGTNVRDVLKRSSADLVTEMPALKTSGADLVTDSPIQIAEHELIPAATGPGKFKPWQAIQARLSAWKKDHKKGSGKKKIRIKN